MSRLLAISVVVAAYAVAGCKPPKGSKLQSDADGGTLIENVVVCKTVSDEFQFDGGEFRLPIYRGTTPSARRQALAKAAKLEVVAGAPLRGLEASEGTDGQMTGCPKTEATAAATDDAACGFMINIQTGITTGDQPSQATIASTFNMKVPLRDYRNDLSLVDKARILMNGDYEGRRLDQIIGDDLGTIAFYWPRNGDQVSKNERVRIKCELQEDGKAVVDNANP